MNAQRNEALRFHRWSTVVVLAALLAIFPLAVAAEGLDPNTIVSPDGALFTAPEAGLTASEYFLPAEEPEILPSWYTLPAPPDLLPLDPPDRSVIGADGRTQVFATSTYPWRAIAYLAVTFPSGSFMCTGWFIGPRTVVTAGHCVYDQDTSSWATSITVYPGRNGASYPYGGTTIAPGKLRSTVGWVTNNNISYDYGAMFTTPETGKTVGYFGFRIFQNTDLGMRVRITGYPGDKPSGTMWTMRGRVQHKQTKRIYYSIDTYGGQSGAPVYGVGPYAVGIHTYATGADAVDGLHNSATRITAGVFNNLYNWKYYPAQ